MVYLFHDSIGFVHLLSAIIALITGTCVLASIYFYFGKHRWEEVEP